MGSDISGMKAGYIPAAFLHGDRKFGIGAIHESAQTCL
jgi:hypothetical protein